MSLDIDEVQRGNSGVGCPEGKFHWGPVSTDRATCSQPSQQWGQGWGWDETGTPLGRAFKVSVNDSDKLTFVEHLLYAKHYSTTLYTLTLGAHAPPWNMSFYYLHLADEESDTERLSNLPKDTELVRRTGLGKMISKVFLWAHWRVTSVNNLRLTLLIYSVICSVHIHWEPPM